MAQRESGGLVDQRPYSSREHDKLRISDYTLVKLEWPLSRLPRLEKELAAREGPNSKDEDEEPDSGE